MGNLLLTYFMPVFSANALLALFRFSDVFDWMLGMLWALFRVKLLA